MKRFYTIKDDEGQVRGELFIEDDSNLPVLDIALTPIVQIAKDEEPKTEAFLISSRTTLDIRPREEEWPYRHLGHVSCGGSLPDITETEEFERLDEDD
jgi:hypothetical protein